MSKVIYPKSNKECIKLLEALGFRKKIGIGNSKHPEKYIHPKRRNICPDDKPFVLVTHEYFEEKAKVLMKKLQCWDFSKKEITDTYNSI